jgi:NAD(P)-dependent dehydrogenase (short-subunit alcohol dehydrogenase family)
MNLKDKVVVITGASRGLGKALALALAKEGAKLVLGARSKNELDELAKQTDAVAVAADVTREEEVLDLAETAVNKFGRLDIWINNAGMWIPHGLIVSLDMKRVHEMVEVNLFGTIYGSKAALLQMQKQHKGTIVNILSTSALEGRAGSSGYGASKFATLGFTKALVKEAEPEGIHVIAIYPGGMRTHLFDESKPENYQDYMDPAEVAQKIVENLKQEEPEAELIIKRKTA